MSTMHTVRRTLFLVVLANMIRNERRSIDCTLDEARLSLDRWLDGRPMDQDIAGILSTMSILRIRSLSFYLEGAPCY